MPNFSKLALSPASPDGSSPPRPPRSTHQQQHQTRVPLTHMNNEEMILDNTFGDSLQSLSDSLSSLNENELLEIIEENRGNRIRSRRRNYAVFALVIVCVSAIAVALSVARREHDGGPLRADGSSTGSNMSVEGESESDAWGTACSDQSISADAGREQCAEACRIYECCKIDPDEAGSCAAHKAADCSRFWVLCDEVLGLDVAKSVGGGEGGGVGGPAAGAAAASATNKQKDKDAAAISRACEGANSNGVKFQECSRLCEEHLCCFEMYGGGCKDLTEYECPKYEPCSVLAMDLAQAIVQHVGQDHEVDVEGEGEEDGDRIR